MTRLLRWSIRVQGVYYLVTGIWPLVSLRTFEMVTGPKYDDWLVQTVGVLAAAIGIALLTGASRPRPSAETLVLAAGSAMGFAAIDLVFVLGGRIPPIYLMDAAAEIVFLVILLLGGLASRRDSRSVS